MGKCREALKEEGGDLEKAVHWLRMRGVKSMERRTADSAEALLGLAMTKSAGAIVEMRAETDFVTRSDVFQKFCLCIAHTAAKAAESPRTEAPASEASEALLQLRLEADEDSRPRQLREGALISEALLEMGSVLGEKLLVAEAKLLQMPPGGVIAGYVHPKQTDGLPGTGRLASLVALRPSPPGCDLVRLQLLATQLARHVVAAQPKFLSIASIPAEIIRKEREAFKASHLEQLGPRKSGTVDDKVMEKVLDGKTQKFYQDSVLMCQELVVQSSEEKSLPVAEWLEVEAKALGLEKIVLEDFRLSAL